MTNDTELRGKAEVQSALDGATGNAVAYSALAWAVARKSSSGEDRWFPDSGAWSTGTSLNSGEMVSWADDWALLRGGDE